VNLIIFTPKAISVSTSQKISAVVITKNEGTVIEKFLDQLSFVDQIVLVDSGSEDDTVEKAKKFQNVSVFTRPFDNFSAQKNFGIDQVKHPWILFFDPDEAVLPSLKKEILDAVIRGDKDAYFVRRQLYFMGKKINYSGFQTDWVIRLGRKNSCRYNGNLVHETMEVTGATGKLKTRLPHYTYKSMPNYLAKLDQYSSLQAQMAFERGKKAGLIQLIWRPWYRFWHQYIIRLGILDGLPGYVLATINAHSVFKRYVKLYLLNRGGK
jgi:glycosyltransferase involved in cell wall biosynthesis